VIFHALLSCGAGHSPVPAVNAAIPLPTELPPHAFIPGFTKNKNPSEAGINLNNRSSFHSRMFRARNPEFEALALPLLEPLYNFAYWLAQNRDEAQDLVQETFAKSLRGFDGFQRGTNFKAWIFRILRNTFLTSRTGLRAIPMLDIDDPAVEPPATTTDDPERHLLRIRDREAIEKAMETLPVHYREVVLLCDVEEMSYQEIADLLQIPIGTVMSRLARGRRHMRALLQQNELSRKK
jgi:RNA polymerase sigma-70 factor (ECF subfamily)